MTLFTNWIKASLKNSNIWHLKNNINLIPKLKVGEEREFKIKSWLQQAKLLSKSFHLKESFPNLEKKC